VVSLGEHGRGGLAAELPRRARAQSPNAAIRDEGARHGLEELQPALCSSAMLASVAVTTSIFFSFSFVVQFVF
jgi:hypothetical protein